MKREDLINGIQELKEITADEWRQAVEMYPMCEIILWHYLRTLYRNDDISFENELLRLGLRLGDREAFYRFMTRQKVQQAFPELAATTGNWFDDIDNRTEERKATLIDLARKLKAERLAAQAKREQEKAKKEQPEPPTPPVDEMSEQDKEVRVKQLIAEKKYSEALEILRSINLSNSKKSTTFAVQIKWLETIINNT